MNRRTEYRELPKWLRRRLNSALRLWVGIDWGAEYHSEMSLKDFDKGRGRETVVMPEAEAVSSRWEAAGEDQHMVLIDIDVPAALIPSTNADHHHLYIETPVPWEDYLDLLRAMVKCRIVEPGFLRATEARGEAFLRLPWIRKGNETDDAREALENWLDE